MPLVNTTWAASGSHQMLNSAAGVTLPNVSEPPISVIPAMRVGRVGSLMRADAMFVSGPTGTSWRSGTLCERAMMTSTACSSRIGTVGGGISGPSRPLSPWTSGA